MSNVDVARLAQAQTIKDLDDGLTRHVYGIASVRRLLPLSPPYFAGLACFVRCVSVLAGTLTSW